MCSRLVRHPRRRGKTRPESWNSEGVHGTTCQEFNSARTRRFGAIAHWNLETPLADWPILNTFLNSASGATWVSVHHGGGGGGGYSIHACRVICVDGSANSSKRVSMVLTNDPGIGIARHADAGYDEAKRAAKKHRIRIPIESR